MAEPIIRLLREDDDPLCLRASIGGLPELGYYCTFRGDKDKIIACLEIVLKALKSNQPVKDQRTHQG